jgi:hypothetical protein
MRASNDILARASASLRLGHRLISMTFEIHRTARPALHYYEGP